MWRKPGKGWRGSAWSEPMSAPVDRAGGLPLTHTRLEASPLPINYGAASERKSPHCVALPARERYDRNGAVLPTRQVPERLVDSCPLCTRHVVGIRPQSGPFPSLWAQPKTRLQRRFPSGESRD